MKAILFCTPRTAGELMRIRWLVSGLVALAALPFVLAVARFGMPVGWNAGSYGVVTFFSGSIGMPHLAGSSFFSFEVSEFHPYGGPEVGVTVPLWYLGLLAAVGTIVAFVVYHRKTLLRQRAASGLCPRCGYDLRASKDRCPECGDRCRIDGNSYRRTSGMMR